MPPANVSSFRLYNTLTRTVEPLRLLKPEQFRFYSCGPTVYAYAHIGNFRTFVTADLILRTARALGWQTKYVSNVTDVGHLTEDDVADTQGEDRMAKALHSKEGEAFANVWDLAEHYTRALVRDWHTLNLIEPDVRPRATQHIREQIQAVQALLEAEHAYETSNAVYYDVSSFPAYGKLSGNTDAEGLEEAVRDIVMDPEKRNPRDFALWKKDDKHLMQWYSPWGWGFPGWHIECSVMARQYLGDTFDLHAGGEDLIFPHHECEIAQAESLSGKPFATHWAHTRFLQVEGKKMSKSAGNFFTVQDLVAPEAEGGRGVPPLALRYTLMSGHYRKPFNFTFKTLKDSARIVRRYQTVAEQVQAALQQETPGPDLLGPDLDAAYTGTLEALLDDLNTPLALSRALEGVKVLEGLATMNQATAQRAQMWLDQIQRLLGIVYPNASPAAAPAAADAEEDAFVQQVETMLEARKEARAARDWAMSDAIREALLAMDVEIQDTPTGAVWKKKTDY